MGILVNIITLVAMAWIMFGMNWQLTLIALSVVPLLRAHHRATGRFSSSVTPKAMRWIHRLTTAIQRSVASIGLVQAFGRENDEYSTISSTRSADNIAVKMKLHWDEVMYWLILGMIFAVGAAAIFGYGAILVSARSARSGDAHGLPVLS